MQQESLGKTADHPRRYTIFSASKLRARTASNAPPPLYARMQKQSAMGSPLRVGLPAVMVASYMDIELPYAQSFPVSHASLKPACQVRSSGKASGWGAMCALIFVHSQPDRGILHMNTLAAGVIWSWLAPAHGLTAKEGTSLCATAVRVRPERGCLLRGLLTRCAALNCLHTPVRTRHWTEHRGVHGRQLHIARWERQPWSGLSRHDAVSQNVKGREVCPLWFMMKLLIVLLVVLLMLLDRGSPFVTPLVALQATPVWRTTPTGWAQGKALHYRTKSGLTKNGGLLDVKTHPKSFIRNFLVGSSFVALHHPLYKILFYASRNVAWIIRHSDQTPLF